MARDRVGEARDQIGQRRLAATVGADDRDCLAKGNLQGHIVQDSRAGMILERHAFEAELAAMPRARQGILRAVDGRLAVQASEDPVAGRDAALQPAEDVGELSHRIGRAKEETIEEKERTEIQGPRGQRDAQQAHFALEHQPGPGQQRQTDDEDAHALGNGMGKGVVAGNLHRLAVIFLAAHVEPPALVGLAGEGLDDLDAAEGLFQDVEDLHHLLHRPAIGPFEHLAQPADGQRSQRDHNHRKQQEPPADPCRPHQAGDHLQGLDDQFSENRFQSVADVGRVVGEAAHQVRGAFVVEGGQVQPQGAAIEELAQIERGQVGQPGHEHVVGNYQEALQNGADQQHDHDQDECLEGIVGQVAIEIGFDPDVRLVGQRFVVAAAFQGTECRLQLRLLLRACGGKLGPALRDLLVQIADGLVAAIDFIANPGLDRLAFQDDLDERIGRPDVASPKHGHTQRAEDRSYQGQAIAAGHSKHTAEVFHSARGGWSRNRRIMSGFITKSGR